MAHRHAHRGPPYKCVEIDPTVCLQPINGGGRGISRAGQPVPEYFAGFIIAHDRDGFPHRCEGMVTVERQGADGPTWQMTGSLDGGDLTLSPSVLCSMGSLDDPASGTTCGFHGFVRDGHWVTA